MLRRLAAIMVADAVGSTEAMAADEETALTGLLTAQTRLRERVEARSGRVFNTAGDAIFAEFSSPVEALRAAMEGRAALAEDGAADATMRWGLHLADVVDADGDLRGDGVNIAARIEQAAGAGQIDVSGPFFDQVRRNSPCRFEDLGLQTLRGAGEPIHIYRVREKMERHVYQVAPSRAPSPQEGRRREHSVAVAPFRFVGGDPENLRFLADGLTEDLIFELSRLRRLYVSSRTASYALASDDPVSIGEALGVRYVVTGALRATGPRVRLNLALAETERGDVLWTDRIEGTFDEIYEALDAAITRIAATVSGRIFDADISRARTRATGSMTAYEYYLRGMEMHRLGAVTMEHVDEALRWFRRATEADPEFGRARAMYVCAWSYKPDFEIGEAMRITERALQSDPSDPEVNRIMGSIKMMEGDFEASRVHHERALQNAPSDAYILGRCAAFYAFSGEPERAIELLDRAAELDPFLPVWCVEDRVAALYAAGRHDEALEAARALPTQTIRSRLYRAAIRMERGDAERARALVRSALADMPALDTEFIRSEECFRDPELKARLLRSLVAAGLPERAPELAAS